MPKISSSPDNIKVTCTLQPVQGWEQNGDNCYLWSTNEKNWSDAEEFCVNEGGHLASVTSDAIEEYVMEEMNIKGLNAIWIGGTDIHQEGVWQWTDNMPWEFTSWYGAEPNNKGGNEDCLEMVQGGGWNDQSCHEEFRFLCSKKTHSGDAYI